MNDVLRAKTIFGLIVVAFGLLVGVAHAVPPCRYTVETIVGPPCGPLFGNANIQVTGIDESGRVACTIECGGGSERACTWTAEGGLVQITGFPTGTYRSFASGIAEGWVCGSFEFSTPQGSGHYGFLASAEGLIVVPPPVQPATLMLGSINADGTACGNSLGAILYSNGVVTNLFPGEPFSNLARGLNANAQITGYFGFTMLPGNYHGFIWNDGKIIDLGLGLPGAFATEGRAINSKGEVCGVWLSGPSTPTGHLRRGFHWDGQSLHDLPTGPQVGAIISDMNDASQIVGNLSVLPNSGGPAALWEDGKLYRIDMLTGPLPFVIAECTAINGGGQIAAIGIDDGDDIGLVLTPVFPQIGDTNCDEVINVDDLLGVINHWQAKGGREDFNDDGIVNIHDLIEVILNWG